jgi:Zn finger protein HypA/HybF involved in hydrogenase expression
MPISFEPCVRKLVKCLICQDYFYLVYPTNYKTKEVTMECPSCNSTARMVIHRNEDTCEMFQDIDKEV